MARVAVIRQEGANDPSKVFVEVGYDFAISEPTNPTSDSHSVTDIITRALEGVVGDVPANYSGFEIVGGGFHDLTGSHKAGDNVSFQVTVGGVVVGQNEKHRPIPYAGGDVSVDALSEYKPLPKQMNIGSGDQDVAVVVTVNRGTGAASPANNFILGYWLKIRLLHV